MYNYSPHVVHSVVNTPSVCQLQPDATLQHKIVQSFIIISHNYIYVPSVLWRCWLGGRKGIQPVKNCLVGCWRGYLSGVRCRLAYGPADAAATHCLLLQWHPDWFNFLVPADPGSPGQRAVKWVCVYIYEQQKLKIYTVKHGFSKLSDTNAMSDNKHIYWPPSLTFATSNNYYNSKISFIYVREQKEHSFIPPTN